MPHLHKGLLIAIEGIDGSGKSTLAHTLHQKLYENGYNTVLTKEPGDTSLGKKIRELVQHQDEPIDPKAEYLLFGADRAQHFSTVIIPALKEKKLILSDRLADSSLAYQGYGRGLNLTLLKTINEWAMQKIKPDLTIFVEAPLATVFTRIALRNKKTTSFEKELFLQKVALGFKDIYHNRTDVITLDGTQNAEHLAQEAFNSIVRWIKNHTQ